MLDSVGIRCLDLPVIAADSEDKFRHMLGKLQAPRPPKYPKSCRAYYVGCFKWFVSVSSGTAEVYRSGYSTDSEIVGPVTVIDPFWWDKGHYFGSFSGPSMTEL